MRNTHLYQIVVGITEGKKPLGKIRPKIEDRLK
jgi:hypothetical protein